MLKSLHGLLRHSKGLTTFMLCRSASAKAPLGVAVPMFGLPVEAVFTKARNDFLDSACGPTNAQAAMHQKTPMLSKNETKLCKGELLPDERISKPCMKKKVLPRRLM